MKKLFAIALAGLLACGVHGAGSAVVTVGPPFVIEITCPSADECGPFVPLSQSWQGRDDLMVLGVADVGEFGDRTESMQEALSAVAAAKLVASVTPTVPSTADAIRDDLGKHASVERGGAEQSALSLLPAVSRDTDVQAAQQAWWAENPVTETMPWYVVKAAHAARWKIDSGALIAKAAQKSLDLIAAHVGRAEAFVSRSSSDEAAALASSSAPEVTALLAAVQGMKDQADGQLSSDVSSESTSIGVYLATVTALGPASDAVSQVQAVQASGATKAGELTTAKAAITASRDAIQAHLDSLP